MLAYLVSLPVDKGPTVLVQIVLATMVCAFWSFVGLVLGVVGIAKWTWEQTFAAFEAVLDSLSVRTHWLSADSRVLMRSKISSASGLVASSTTRPSARKITRSATAAARGSWVTMTTV